MAPYQLLKLDLVAWFGLSKDAFHILLGFAVFLIFLFLLKKKPVSWKFLIPPLTFAIILEIMDVRDALTYNLKPDLMDSLKDIIITIICPVLLVACLRYRQKKY